MDEQKIIAAILAAGCIVSAKKKTDAAYAVGLFEDCLVELRKGKGSDDSIKDRLERAQRRLQQEDSNMDWTPAEPQTGVDT